LAGIWPMPLHFPVQKPFSCLGELAAAGDFIFSPTKEHMEKNLLKIFQNKVKLLPSACRIKMQLYWEPPDSSGRASSSLILQFTSRSQFALTLISPE